MNTNNSRVVVLVSAILAAAVWTAPALAQPGKADACTACHGANGIAVSDDIPNLAGQNGKYLTTQLEAFRDGKRKNTLMNAIAGQLTDADIKDVVAYFAAQGKVAGSQASPLGEMLAAGSIDLPSDYATSMTLYTTINRADNKQVRNLYANDIAMKSARSGAPLADGSLVIIEIFKAKLDADGKPVMGADGYFEKGARAAFTAMQRQPGWGARIPELLRNGDWNYAVYSADQKAKAGVNQAKCLACHRPLADSDYMFSFDALVAKAKGG